jgi:hypothetical protein
MQPEFPRRTIEHINQRTGLDLRETTNHFQAAEHHRQRRRRQRRRAHSNDFAPQDGERHAPDGQRAARGHRPTGRSRSAGQLDHAGQVIRLSLKR